MEEAILHYISGKSSFVEGALPTTLLAISEAEVLTILRKKFGSEALQRALSPEFTTPGPLQQHSTPEWLKTTNMVGINVRTIGNFWNVVKYAFSLPDFQQSIHLLPIWEPGVVGSLYGMASWNINPEFFSAELHSCLPQLNTVEQQLKVVVNILHLMGKVVGMDVIPHVDRYSEIVLTHPHYFEWLKRDGMRIVDHSADLHEEVQQEIYQFLGTHGIADYSVPFPQSADHLFSQSYGEANRLRLFFGKKENQQARFRRRDLLIEQLYQKGLEPVPATMAPPYRGLEVDPEETAKTVDEKGRVWRDYRITKPQKMSRVFGPLTRFKLYNRLDNNQHWAIDFNQPQEATWNYICQKYSAIQQTYSFDFMRCDMSHVQMRSEGAPQGPLPYYDIHQEVKNSIRKHCPWFAYYAEGFLAPPNAMAYGIEEEHLVASEAEVTLGDLQSMVVGSTDFLYHFHRYLAIARKYPLRPCFTIMTADKDDPRFDQFYLSGNESRLFMGLFLTDFPSYVGLGFECRDPHPAPVPNEWYTKLYVFQIREGHKATHGPYRWGQNHLLFYRLDRIKQVAATLLPELPKASSTQWILPPDPLAKQKVMVWTQQESSKFIFIVNVDLENSVELPKIHNLGSFLFSSHKPVLSAPNLVLSPGECRIYKPKN